MADEREKALSKLRETFASELEDEKRKLKDEHKEALEELREKLEKERDVVCEIYSDHHDRNNYFKVKSVLTCSLADAVIIMLQ